MSTPREIFRVPNKWSAIGLTFDDAPSSAARAGSKAVSVTSGQRSQDRRASARHGAEVRTEAHRQRGRPPLDGNKLNNDPQQPRRPQSIRTPAARLLVTEAPEDEQRTRALALREAGMTVWEIPPVLAQNRLTYSGPTLTERMRLMSVKRLGVLTACVLGLVLLIGGVQAGAQGPTTVLKLYSPPGQTTGIGFDASNPSLIPPVGSSLVIRVRLRMSARSSVRRAEPRSEGRSSTAACSLRTRSPGRSTGSAPASHTSPTGSSPSAGAAPSATLG